MLCAAATQAGGAETGAPAAFPAYRAEQVVQGLYGVHLPARAQAFETSARALQAALHAQCGKPGGTAPLERAWLGALQAWQSLATPAVGPVLARRSQRRIDFWPVRPALIERALSRAPRSLADMERVGTPAKGFPALEWLLDQPLNAARCTYADLIAQGIEAEARALSDALKRAAAAAAEEGAAEEGGAVGAAFAEWVNQWLGGLERLRWMHVEQPLEKARTRGTAPEFARRSRSTDLADWRAQWRALHGQARLRPEQLARPPVPGRDVIPIEALLYGKGHIALAQRWAAALDRVEARLAALQPESSADALMALSADMKAVATLFQSEVAPVLDVPLGFSDADGD